MNQPSDVYRMMAKREKEGSVKNVTYTNISSLLSFHLENILYVIEIVQEIILPGLEGKIKSTSGDEKKFYKRQLTLYRKTVKNMRRWA